MKKMSTKEFLDTLIAADGSCLGCKFSEDCDCERDCPIACFVDENDEPLYTNCYMSSALKLAKEHYDELVAKEQEDRLDMRSRACTDCETCNDSWKCRMEGSYSQTKMEEPKLLLSFDGPTKQELLATDHWQYVKGLMENAGIKGEQLNLLAYMYKTAFIHGWKHAKEDNNV